jgi:hypothetical protein
VPYFGFVRLVFLARAASAVAILAAVAACEGPPSSAPLTRDPVTDVGLARTWLVQKVCADARGAQPFDPYSAIDPWGDGGCPAGTVQRELAPTDVLPYRRYTDLTSPGAPLGSAISVPVWDADGRAFVMMQRSFSPDGDGAFDTRFSHFDTYRIGADWISQYGTRDSASFNTTFFGATDGAVTPYNGWTDFPATSFLLTAWTAAADVVLGSHWELCGLPPPGNAPSSPSGLGTGALQYRLIADFPFGSAGGTRKVMHTMAANHQSAPVLASGNPDEGHAEIWYFTVPYGPTRWEVWSAADCLRPDAQPSCLPAFVGNCADGPTTQAMPFMGVEYTYRRVMCRDWSNVVVDSAAMPAPVPYWPSPQANLLANFHFGELDPARPGSAPSQWQADPSLTVEARQSAALYDTTVGGSGGAPSGCAAGVPAGVRYVALACTAAGAPCGSIWQDVPLASHAQTLMSGPYAFGVTVRVDPAAGGAPAPMGTLTLTLEQVDAGGTAVAGVTNASVTAIVGPAVASNVASPDPTVQQHLTESVVLSSAYVQTTASIVIDPRTAALRLRITPQSPGVTFDLIDASLARLGP